MKKKVKTFDVTEDGRYQFRPFGTLGATYEIPDRGRYNTARYVTGILFVIIAVSAVANIFFYKQLIFMLLILGTFAGYVIWLMIAKAGWKKLD